MQTLAFFALIWYNIKAQYLIVYGFIIYTEVFKCSIHSL